MSAAVAESGRPLQAVLTGSGLYRRPLPLQGAGGGRDGGRYKNNALRQDASTTVYSTDSKAVAISVGVVTCTAITVQYS
jgi:hypothetical protein